MIKAIETTYKGYKFRSRLEARWAVFFNGIKANWKYEPEGYELPSGRYLPDFFVQLSSDDPMHQHYPGSGYWVEIKGSEPKESEFTLLSEVCAMTNHTGYLVSGEPCDCLVWRIHRIKGISERGKSNPTKVQIEQLNHEYEMPFLFGFFAFNGKRLNEMRDAAYASRSARFEFGRSGALA